MSIANCIPSAQNCEINILACQRAITARTRMSTIHIMSAPGMKELAQYSL